MSKNYDLANDSVSKLFAHYATVAVMGIVVMAINVVLDGIFIGRGVGSIGLGAVNIAGALYPFLIGIGTMIGVGSAAAISVEFGKGNEKTPSSVFGQALIISTVLALFLTIGINIFLEPLSRLMGANDVLLPGVTTYLRTISFFIFFYVNVLVLDSAVRNDHAPKKGMAAIIMGAVTNAILNYIFIFVFGWGLKGAALATGVGQILAFSYLLHHFIFKKGKLYIQLDTIKFEEMKRILKNGVPNFLSLAATAGIVVIANNVTIGIESEFGVAAFGAAMYISNFFVYVFSGIANAVQPLISFNFGAKAYNRVKEVVKVAVRVMSIVGIGSIILIYFGAENIIKLFTKEPKLVEMAAIGIKILIVANVVYGVNLVLAAYFQSIERPKESSIILTLQEIVFMVPLFILLPKFFGMYGVWWSPLTANTFTLCAGIYLIKTRADLLNREPMCNL